MFVKLLTILVAAPAGSLRLNPSKYNCKVFHLVEETQFSQRYGTSKHKIKAELCRTCAGTGYIPCSDCDYEGCDRCNGTGLLECQRCGGCGVWNPNNFKEGNKTF